MTCVNQGDGLAPPDRAIRVAKDSPVCCDNCAFYSPKVFCDDESQGKCFRDRRASGDKVWWVYHDMTCPQFKKDENPNED